MFGEALGNLDNDQKKMALAEEMLVPWMKSDQKALAGNARAGYGRVLLSLANEEERVKLSLRFQREVKDKDHRFAFLLDLTKSLKNPDLIMEVLKHHYLPLLKETPDHEPDSIKFAEDIDRVENESERIKLASSFYPHIPEWSMRSPFLWGVNLKLKSEWLRLKFLREHYFPQLLKEKPKSHEMEKVAEVLNKTEDPRKRLALYKEFLLPLSPDIALNHYWKTVETIEDQNLRIRLLAQDYWEAILTAIQKEGADQFGQHHLDRYGNELLKIRDAKVRLKIADETLLKLSKKGDQHAYRVAKWVYDRVKKGSVK